MLRRWFCDPTPSLRVSLPPGRHQYKFVVDGKWCHDGWSTSPPPLLLDSRPCVTVDQGIVNNVIDVSGTEENVTCGQLSELSATSEVANWAESWNKGGFRPAVIADIGSGRTRVGYSNNELPPFDVESVHSFPHHQGYLPEQTFYWGKCVGINKYLFYGRDCMLRSLTTEMFEQGLKFLGATSDHPVVFAEPLGMESRNWQELAHDILGDSCPAVFFAPSALLALYSTGRTSGLVVDCGENITRAIPIFEGQILTSSCKKMALGGRDISQHLRDLQEELRVPQLQYIKHNLAYVAQHFLPEVQVKERRTYSLPDGETVDLGPELIQIPEPMFTPTLIKNYDTQYATYTSPKEGIQIMCHNAISSCQTELQKLMFQNTVLAGGNSLFPGFHNRLTKEITQLCHPGTKVRVIAHPSRAYAAWLGYLSYFIYYSLEMTSKRTNHRWVRCCLS
ncbi:actin, cytoplasmic 2 [Pelomyxa schiedti]|nr:actin, cytoplasmic 2 [Pelomyxa schiedti]